MNARIVAALLAARRPHSRLLLLVAAATGVGDGRAGNGETRGRAGDHGCAGDGRTRSAIAKPACARPRSRHRVRCPPGSTMAAIAERGRLIVGVDQNTYLFGSRNPVDRPARGIRHRCRSRDRPRHLRRPRPHRAEGGRCEPTGVGADSQARSTWWSGRTRSPANAKRASRSPRRTSTPTSASSPRRGRESIRPLTFPANGCAR